MQHLPIGVRGRRVLVANLAAQVGIVVTGGLVRLTGSGLGCPTWPQCAPGTYTPVLEQEQGIHAYIEFGNRLLTFVVAIAAVAALVAVLRHRGRRPGLARLAALPLAGVLLQVVLGGFTVLTRLHPATVAAHFLVSMALVAVSTLLLVRATEPPVATVAARPEVRALGAALAGVLAVVLVLGTVVTGSGPHSGDATQPARFAFDPRTVSWLHADLVLLFVGLVVALVVALRLLGAPAGVRRRATVLLVLTLAQGGIGYVQYLTGLPEALVLAHMLGASALVVALTAVLAALRVPVDGEPGPDGHPASLSSRSATMSDAAVNPMPVK